MELPTNREKVFSALIEALRSDRARSNVLRISELGLVEMTRKRVRESMEQQLTETCPYCEGRGHIKSFRTVCHEVLREIRRQAGALPAGGIVVSVHPEVADLMMSAAESDYIQLLEERYGKHITVDARPDFHIEQFEINVNFAPEADSEEPAEEVR
jgi:ribonuclease G